MLASDLYRVPGTAADVVHLKIQATRGQATFRNELGIYAVADGVGQVAGVLPGDPGYARAALSDPNHQVLLKSKRPPRSTIDLTVAGGTQFGFYLVANASASTLLARNPTAGTKLPHAYFSGDVRSADGFDHVRVVHQSGGRDRFTFEDQWHGGDRDFNDGIVTVTLVSIEHQPTGGTPGTGDTPVLTPPVVPAPPDLPIVPMPTPSAPTLSAALARPTRGMLVSDPTVVGKVVAPGGAAKLTGTLDGVVADLSDRLLPDGTFVLGPDRLNQVAGRLADGFHTLILRASDRLGQTSDAATVSFVLDTMAAPPTLGLVADTGVDAADGITSDPTVRGTASDPNGITVVQVALDAAAPAYHDVTAAFSDGAFRLNSSDLAAAFGSPLANGTNTILARVVDAAGNVSASARLLLTLDTVAPTVAITDPTTGATETGNPTITGAIADALSGVAAVIATIDGGAPFPVGLDAAGRFAFPTAFPLDGTVDGPHTVTVRAQDRAGNLSDSASVSFALLTARSAYVFSQVGGSPAGQGSAAVLGSNLVLRAGDSSSATLTYAFTTPPASATLEFDYANLSFGPNAAPGIRDAFEVALVDPDGQTLVQAIAPDRSAAFNITDGQPGLSGTNTVVAGSTIRLDLSNITPGTAARLVVRLVSDAPGSGTSVVVGPPRVVPGGLGTPLGATVTAAVASATRSAGNLRPDTLADVSGSVRLDYGRTTLGTSPYDFATSIRVVNLAPAAIAGPLIVAFDRFSDPAVEVVRPSGFLPDGRPYLDLTGALPVGGLDEGEATAPVDLSFRDPTGARFTYRATVLAQLNAGPSAFSSSPVLQIGAGRTYRYQAVAVDPTGETLTYAVGTGPSGLAIDPQSGLVTWATTSADVGNQAVAIRATDPHGQSVDQRFTLEVVDGLPNRPPVFTTTPPTDALVTSPFPVLTYATGANPVAATAGNFGSGGISLVTANPGEQALGLLGGSTPGRWSPSTPVSVGEPSPATGSTTFVRLVTVDLGFAPGTDGNFERNVSGVQAADVNGDGTPDVVALVATGPFNIGDSRDVGGVAVRLGNGDGTFRRTWQALLPPVVNAGSEAGGLRVADVTGDGIADLVVDQMLGRKLLVYRGVGDGTFDDPIVSPVEGSASSIQLVDVNRDGKLDVVRFESNTLGRFRSGISVWLGDGLGHFGGGDFLAAPTDSGGAGYLVDADGRDGPDLVRVNYGNQRLEVHLNDGTGHFGSEIDSRVYAFTGDGYPYNDSPLSAYFGDFDRDGEVDAAVSTAVNGIYFLRGTGDGRFGDGTPSGNHANMPIYSPSGFDNFPTAAGTDGLARDLNGDGIPDLVFGNSSDAQLGIGFGRGDGTFSQAFYDASATPDIGTGTVRPAQATPNLALADFNRDGVLDILVGAPGASSRPGLVALVLGDKPGTFRAPLVEPFAKGYGQAPYVTADFNGDGLPDIAAIVGRTVEVALGRGDGTFEPFRTALQIPAGSGEFYGGSLLARDFDGDGRIDLALVGTSGVQSGPAPRYIQAQGLGDGTFRILSIESIPGGWLPDLSQQVGVVGDLDGDGHPDLAYRVTNGGATRVDVLLFDPSSGGFALLPDPDGLLGPIARSPGYYQDTAIGLADLDGDGLPEIFVHSIAIAAQNGSPAIPERFTILKAGGHGAADATALFSKVVITDPGLSPTRPIRGYAVGDFNRDGRIDLAYNLDTGVTDVAFGNGDGTFRRPTAYLTNSNGQIATADIDGDGLLDLVSDWTDFGNFSQRSLLSALLGRPDGTFGPAQQLTTTNGSSAGLALGDFNLDGRSDLMTAGSGGAAEFLLSTPPGLAGVVAADLDGDGRSDLVAIQTGFDRVKLLLGSGANGFVRQPDLFVGASPVDFRVADLDGDGQSDIVTANRVGQSLTVLRNQGNGSFARSDLALPDRPSHLSVGDLTGDGRPDLVAISDAGHSLTVLVAGAGGFGAARSIDLGFTPGDLALADVTGDGRLDVILSDPTGRRLAILPGQGDGTFGTARFVALAAAPDALAATDLNGDGRPDLAVALRDDGKIALFFGLGGGRFSTAQLIAVGRNPSSIAAVDADGDGRPDLLVTNAGDSTLSVVLNRYAAATLYRYTPTATDPDGDPVTLELANAPGGMIFDAVTGQILWAPTPDQVGSNAVEIRASDGVGGVATQGFTIQVTPAQTSSPPVFTSTPATTIAADSSFTYQPTVSGSGQAPLRYSLASGPAGLQVDPTTGAVSWDPRASGLSLDLAVKNGDSVRFDPSGGVDVPDSPSLRSPSVTAEGWFKLDANSYTGLIRKDFATSGFDVSTASWEIRNYYGTPQVVIGSDFNPTAIISAPSPLQTSRWYHLALTFDDATRTLSFYINGSLVGSTVVPVSLQYSDRPLQIGSNRNLLGTVASVRIWSVARTAEQIAADTYTEIPPDSPGLVADYRFAEGSDVATVVDASPFQNNGTIVTDRDLFRYPERVPSLATAGDYPVTLRVEDGRGGVSFQTFTIHIVSPHRGAIVGTISDSRGTTPPTGLAGYTVFLDANGNGLLDPGEATTQTDSTGVYRFPDLLATAWTVAVAPLAGATVPPPQVVNVAPDGATTANFSIIVAQAGLIRGTVLLDGTTTPIRGFAVFADPNGNGTLDPGEARTTTDAAGRYVLSDLGAGTYFVRLLTPSGWTVSSPPGGSATVTLAAGGDVAGPTLTASPGPGVSTRPVFASAPTLTATARGTYAYAARAFDPIGRAVTYTVAAGPVGLVVDPISGTVLWSPTLRDVGSHRVVLQATSDSGGVAFQDYALVVVSPNTGPIITSTPLLTATIGVPLRYALAAQDAEQTTLSYALITGPAGLGIDAASGLVSWTPDAAQAGPQSVTIVVRDGVGGQAEQSFVLDVSAPGSNHPPAFAVGPRPTAQVGRRYVSRVSATDPDGDALVYDLISGPAGLMVAPDGTLAWTPTAIEFGPNVVRLRVSDGQASTEVDYRIDVGSTFANAAPVLAEVPTSFAVAGRLAAIDLHATDRDGDAIAYALVSGPIGLSLDPQRGTIRWTPGVDQLGATSVVVRALDPFGGVDERTFSIVVRAAGGPPLITSTPSTRAAVGQTYIYAVAASDLEGSPITYTLQATPAGATIDSTTGVISWTPKDDQIGPRSLIVRASSGAGAFATQAFAVVVAAGAPHLPPTATSTPTLDAVIGKAYSYSFSATAPDGVPLAYAVRSGPAGLVVDPVTGVVSWTPTADQVGRRLVVLTATDSAGASAVQSFAVDVQAAQRPPTILSTPSPSVSAGALYSYDVLASNPDRVPLVYRLLSGPEGMTLDGLGHLRWQTATNTPLGPRTAVILVLNSQGEGDTQTINLAVTADTKPPLVSITVENGTLYPWSHDPAIVRVRATDDVGVASLTLMVDDQAVALAPDGTARVFFTTPGAGRLRAIAADVAGNVGRASGQVRERSGTEDGSGNPADGPTVDITSVADGAEVSCVVDLLGTVASPDLLRYTLTYRRADEATTHEIARGTTPVAGASLGSWDTTLLSNDNYILRLEATDRIGNVGVIERSVGVAGNLKLGNFRLSFVDAAIPVAGIPITLARTYDSLQAGQSGAVGYGWTLDFRNAGLRVGLPQTGLEDQGVYTPFRSGVKVYVNVPGKGREGFTFAPDIRVLPGFGGSGLAIATPRFVADRGVGDTLSVGGGNLLVDAAGNLFADGGVPWNPASPDFGGGYTLATAEGITYRIDGNTGLLTSATTTRGDGLSFSEGGITDTTGVRLTFERDPRGRIVAAVDPMGRRVTYRYSVEGDLSAVTDRDGATTTFTYDDPARPHYLTGIIDPLGRAGVRTVYDASGRLTGVSGGGSAVGITYDPSLATETTVDPLGRSTVTQYDSDGNVIAVVDALGGVTRRSYDAQGRLTSQTDPLGRTTTSAYDDAGDLIAVTDPLGRTTRFTYDAQHRLLTTTDPLGATISATYDAAGNLVTQTNALGIITQTNTFDSHGNRLTSTDAAGQTSRFAYNDRGQTTQITTTVGHSLNYTYDLAGAPTGQSTTRTDAAGNTVAITLTTTQNTHGKLTAATGPLGGILALAYDAGGQQTGLVDQAGNQIIYAYDDAGRRTATFYADGTTETTAYDAAGNAVRTTDRAGRSTTYEFDALNRRVHTIYPDGSSTATVYDAAGQVIAQTDENGHTTRTEYDAAGQVLRVTDALGGITTFAYDEDGRRLSVTDATGRTSRTEYDLLGHPIRVIAPDGTATITTYDAIGDAVAVTDANSNVTRFEYDALGRLTRVVDALGRATTYAFDEMGDPIAETDALGHTTRRTYDSQRRLTSVTLPGGQTETSTYNAGGDLASTTDTNGQVTTYTFDSNHQLVTQVFADGSRAEYTYTPTGCLASARDSRGTTAYRYDLRDRLIGVTEPDGRTLAYRYDAAGNRTAVITASGATTSAYDALNRLTTVTDPAGRVTSYTYDASGRLTHTALPDGSTDTRTYDSDGRLAEIATVNGAGTTLFREDYTYDANSNRTGVLGLEGRTVRYTYDALNRLTSETVLDPTATDHVIGYAYDAVGNRLSRTDSTVGTTTYTYDGDDRLLTETTGGATTSYTYDNAGHQTSKVTDAIDYVLSRWDARGRLAEVNVRTSTGTSQTLYGYNAAGDRTSATTNSVEVRTLVSEGDPLPVALETYRPDGSLVTSYTYGLAPISQVTGGALSVYHADATRSVRLLTNAAGAITDRISYDAYGSILSRSGTTASGHLYTGEAFDPASDLVYLRARDYDPRLGRFTSIDPAAAVHADPTTRNRYLYTRGNPVTRTDPSGRTDLAELGQVSVLASLLNLGAIYGNALITRSVFAALPDDAFTSTPDAALISLGISVNGGQFLKEVGLASNPLGLAIAVGLSLVNGIGSFDAVIGSSGVDFYASIGLSLGGETGSDFFTDSLGSIDLAGGLVFNFKEPSNYAGVFVSASATSPIPIPGLVIVPFLGPISGALRNATIFTSPPPSGGTYGFSISVKSSEHFAYSAAFTYGIYLNNGGSDFDADQEAKNLVAALEKVFGGL